MVPQWYEKNNNTSRIGLLCKVNENPEFENGNFDAQLLWISPMGQPKQPFFWCIFQHKSS